MSHAIAFIPTDPISPLADSLVCVNEPTRYVVLLSEGDPLRQSHLANVGASLPNRLYTQIVKTPLIRKLQDPHPLIHVELLCLRPRPDRIGKRA